MVVTEYLTRSGLMPYLEKLKFNLVGYGCTTCIGNSGPLPQEVSDVVVRERPGRRVGAQRQSQLRRPHQFRGARELPDVAAAGGGVTRWPAASTSIVYKEPLGYGQNGKRSRCT